MQCGSDCHHSKLSTDLCARAVHIPADSMQATAIVCQTLCLLPDRMQKEKENDKEKEKEKEKGGPSNASQLAAAFNKSSMMASLGFGSRASANKETLTAGLDTAGVSKVGSGAAFMWGCWLCHPRPCDQRGACTLPCACLVSEAQVGQIDEGFWHPSFMHL